jgi:hypothetical protein
LPTDIDDCYFVDSGITYDSTATSTITGLDHLEGETVTVLADGVEFDDAVVSSGQITLKLGGTTTTASTVQAGLAYTPKLQPMKVVPSGAGGTSYASIQSVHEVGISLLDSAGVKIGTDDDRLYDIDLSRPDWVNLSNVTGLFTGIVYASADGDFSLENPLIISSSSPLPLTVRCIVPRIEITGR